MIEKVLVAGPNGSLGKAIVKHLLASRFNLTLLTRDIAKTKEAFPGIRAVQTTYESEADLVNTLRRSDVGSQDALVILLNRDLVQPQLNLMNAAMEVGITHMIPSCWGIGTRDAYIRDLPIWESKVEIEDYVLKMASEVKLTFTGIQTGLFLDYALDRGLLVNIKDHSKPTVVFDDGNAEFSATTLDDIGKATATVLLKDPQFRNRWVFVHSAVVTQNKIIALAKELHPERDYKILRVDTAELERQAWEKHHAGDRSQETMRDFMPLATFRKGLGLFRMTDNDSLDVELWSDQRLKELVARATAN